MKPLDAILATILALFAGVLSLRFYREGTIRALTKSGRWAKDVAAEIGREAEAKARVAVVKWGVAGALGVTGLIVTGPAAMDYVGHMNFGGATSTSVVLGGGGGGRGTGTVSYDPPTTPTIQASPIDTAAALTTSAFNGSNGDTQDSTIWQIDTVSGSPSFTTPIWADTSDTDLVSYSLAGASVPLANGATYAARAAHKGVNGGWSSFSAPDTFMTSDWPDNEPAGLSAAYSCHPTNDGIIVDGSVLKTDYSGSGGSDCSGNFFFSGDWDNNVSVQSVSGSKYGNVLQKDHTGSVDTDGWNGIMSDPEFAPRLRHALHPCCLQALEQLGLPLGALEGLLLRRRERRRAELRDRHQRLEQQHDLRLQPGDELRGLHRVPLPQRHGAGQHLAHDGDPRHEPERGRRR